MARGDEELKPGQVWGAPGHGPDIRIKAITDDGLLDYGHVALRPVAHFRAWIKRVGAVLKEEF